MKKLLAIAFAFSLLGGTLSAAQAQGTTGSTDLRHANKHSNATAHRNDRAKKPHPAAKKKGHHGNPHPR
jgi:Ni/Co efflux regulator RcnB